MSLLNRATDTVTVFPDEPFTDRDGNTRSRTSATGTEARAVVQPISTSEKEQDGVSTTEERLRLRLVGWKGGELGARSQEEWQGRRYGIHGGPLRYNGSRRTAHLSYEMRRQ